jgi:FKBP-type peptidyl-prolyl cis-trans isomerase
MNLSFPGRAVSRAAMLLAGISAALPSNVAFAAPPPKPGGGQCTQKTASGLGYSILKAGAGAIPGAADNVSIKYKGTLAADGTTFDASDRAEFGVSEVIPGFSEGLKLLKVGGSIRLCIPASLGYGASGAGAIPADADLVFDVDLLEIKAPPGPLAVADRQCTTKSASGLGYTIVKTGAGEMPVNADIALINYKGYVAATGMPFDDAGPVPVPVGQVIPGFSEGLKMMQRGGSYKLCIPPTLGYGEKVVGPIPANSTLVFLIDLIDFKSLAEVQAMQAQPQQ